jgi:hypothetical protein
LALRGAQQTNPQTAAFTISDSSFNAATPNTSILGVLGAGNINNVQQNASNAYGANDNGVANAMTSLFQSTVGFPALETTVVPPPVPGGKLVAGVPVNLQLPSGVNNLQVGQQLTLDAQIGGGSPQENVTITAVSFASGVETVTFTPAITHTLVGPATSFTVTSAQTQTLVQEYGNLVTQVGLDTQPR